MKNLKKLTRKDLVLISGGDTSYAFCDESGYCPPTFPSSYSTYCSNGICYKSNLEVMVLVVDVMNLQDSAKNGKPDVGVFTR